ncbi:membrane protein, putative [Oceanicola granulosus HTCC2516]|uniref:Membrane protein, putative n=1 Tax=Oceanicola granulosus (strain ATCC BAA-861 / DSM 15982 / KCTC 12143 / HTCC2516) TaxID=314256 RepID=Q2CJS6_OCEGH|nr:hypothetical protein [Oceanicola granulosus]EAR53063.1 membrane protein, putative [Oceanicola granulosus HTCC2516]
MSVQIVRHAVLMVLNNFQDAIKASVAPILIGVAVVVGLSMALGTDLRLLLAAASTPGGADTFDETALLNPGSALLILLVMLPLALFILGWVAVTWHRFILLEEYPDPVPAVSGRPIWPYVGKSVGLAVVLMLVFIPLSLVVGLVATPLVMLNEFFGAALAGILLGVVFSYFWLRWALILPAAAIGRPMSMGESWRITKPLSSDIVGVSLLLALLNFALSLVALPFGGGVVGTVLALVVDWFTMMVGLSVLTTLFGHLVEKRALV